MATSEGEASGEALSILSSAGPVCGGPFCAVAALPSCAFQIASRTLFRRWPFSVFVNRGGGSGSGSGDDEGDGHHRGDGRGSGGRRRCRHGTRSSKAAALAAGGSPTPTSKKGQMHQVTLWRRRGGWWRRRLRWRLRGRGRRIGGNLSGRIIGGALNSGARNRDTRWRPRWRSTLTLNQARPKIERASHSGLAAVSGVGGESGGGGGEGGEGGRGVGGRGSSRWRAASVEPSYLRGGGAHRCEHLHSSRPSSDAIRRNQTRRGRRR